MHARVGASARRLRMARCGPVLGDCALEGVLSRSWFDPGDTPPEFEASHLALRRGTWLRYGSSASPQDNRGTSLSFTSLLNPDVRVEHRLHPIGCTWSAAASSLNTCFRLAVGAASALPRRRQRAILLFKRIG